MVTLLPVLIRLSSRKQYFIRLQNFPKYCLALFGNLVFDNGLVPPGLRDSCNKPLAHHVVDYAPVLDVVEPAIAHELALVQLAVL